MKKLLISALVAAMVLGLGSMAFAAAGDIAPAAFSDIAGHEAEGELTLLAALGVFSGEQGLGGAVKPDDPLTRAQFCKVVVEAFEKGNMAAALSGLRPNFVDEVPAWAWGYVNVATYMGVINGYEDGTFGAAKFVTYGEAITMLIRAVGGHKEQVGAGVWPYNYIFYGVDNGFNGPVDVSFASLPTTRGDMARMLFAAMQLSKVDAKGVAVPESAVLFGRVCDGVVSSASAAAVVIQGCGTFAPADPVYIVGAADYAGLIGLNVLAVADTAGDVMFLQVVEASDVFTGVYVDYVDGPDADTAADSLKFADGTLIPADDDANIITLNQWEGLDQLYVLDEGDECTVYLNAQGAASHVVAFRWDIAEDVVDEADKAGPDTDLADITLWDDEGTYDLPATARLTLNGAAVTGDAFAEDDVVKVATLGAGEYWYEGDTVVIAVSGVRNTVEGVVTDTRSVYTSAGQVDYATIGGKEYVDLVGLGKDQTVKVALNAAGELFYNISVVSETPFVLVTGYTSYGDGTAQVVVSSRGATSTYSVPDEYYDANSNGIWDASEKGLRAYVQEAAQAGNFAWIKVSPLTNSLVDIRKITSWSGSYRVDANASGDLTIWNGSSYVFFPASAGYVYYKADGTYVAAADVAVTGTLSSPVFDGSGYNFDEDPDSVNVAIYRYTPPAS